MFWNMSFTRPSSVLRIVFFVLRSKCRDLLSASLKLACPNISVFAPLLRPWNGKSQYAQTRRPPASPACQDLWLHSPWLDIDLQTTNWLFPARNQFKKALKNQKIGAYILTHLRHTTFPHYVRSWFEWIVCTHNTFFIWIDPLKTPFPITMSDMPGTLSQGAKDLLVKVRQIVPPMLEKFHKGETLLQCHWHQKYWHEALPPGQLGRVAVVGGSAKCVCKWTIPITASRWIARQLHRRTLLLCYCFRPPRRRFGTFSPSIHLST